MKKFMMSLAIASIAMVSFAQETVSEVVVPTVKNSVITNSFGSNWFIDVNVGGQVYNPVVTRGEGMFDHLTLPAISVHVGKWHTPGFGWRVGYNGYEIEAYKDVDAVSYYNVHFDALFNVRNLILGYDEKRVWGIIPYVGFGYAGNLDVEGAGGSGKRGSLTGNFGVLQTWRVAKRWAINLELGSMMAKKGFAVPTSNVTSNGYDWAFTAQVGVTYRIGKCTWDNTPDLDAIMALNAAALAELNAQLQAKESENAQLKSQLAAAKNALSQAQVKIKQLENEPNYVDVAQSVFFAFNSSKIASKKEIINLQSLADAAKNSGVKLSVIGYADSATGSAAYNQKLSEARANAVAEKLVELGVPQSQLIVEGKGGVDVEKPARFNRRVIISIAK